MNCLEWSTTPNSSADVDDICLTMRERAARTNTRSSKTIMALPIEDYALIGNLRTAALVGRDGSIDWLCVPRFDDAACFCALLGTPEHGRLLLAPARSVRRTTRRYRNQSLILETEFVTATGAVRVVDFMPTWGDAYGCRAHRGRAARPGSHAHGAGAALRLWQRDSLGAPRRRGACSPRAARIPRRCARRRHPRRGFPHGGGVHGRKRTAHAVRDHVLSVARAAAAAHRSVCGPRCDAVAVGRMVRAMRV